MHKDKKKCFHGGLHFAPSFLYIIGGEEEEDYQGKRDSKLIVEVVEEKGPKESLLTAKK